MVRRPEFPVQVVLVHLIDLFFRLDVSVFGDAEIDTYARHIHLGPVETSISDGLVGAVDGNGTSAGSTAAEFLRLIFELIEVTHAGHLLTHVTNLMMLNARTAFEKGLSEIREVVPIGGR